MRRQHEVIFIYRLGLPICYNCKSFAVGKWDDCDEEAHLCLFNGKRSRKIYIIKNKFETCNLFERKKNESYIKLQNGNDR